MSRATIYIRISNLRNVKNHYKYYKNGLVDETELLVRPCYVGMIVYMVACVGRRPFAQVLAQFALWASADDQPRNFVMSPNFWRSYVACSCFR